MHLPAKVNSLSVQTFMAIKTLSDSEAAIYLNLWIPVCLFWYRRFYVLKALPVERPQLTTDTALTHAHTNTHTHLHTH